jgi:Histidine kinase-, DNA gyrase B-, and HSP90-like ATPase
MSRVRNAPDASSLMATARSFGNYDLAGALADVIDNSISASSRNIDISCAYSESGECSVRIRDDGHGMNRDELLRAMCPASTHPDLERAKDDLGRFGWGMKSASFSQCRILTVISKKQNSVQAARWDLDHITDWEMDFFDEEEAQALLIEPFNGESGTELIWCNCDRLSEYGSINRDQFVELMSEATQKLSQIFHRYLSGDNGRFPRIRISINGTRIKETDPFCEKHPATIAAPEEPMQITAGGASHRVVMQAFVLPHYSKLTDTEYEAFGGKEGYIRNQGFYVYRNRRLIISGTWFGLAKHGELSKLVRVRIDIPNSLDEIWKITLDKSDAQLPSSLRARMRELVTGFRNTSHKVHRSKGAKVDDGKAAPVWSRRVRNGVIRYAVNSEHPLLSALKSDMTSDQTALLDGFLNMVGTQVPVDAIGSEVSSDTDSVQRGFITREELVRFLHASLPRLMLHAGSPSALRELIRKTEPYASNITIVEEELKGILGNG